MRGSLMAVEVADFAAARAFSAADPYVQAGLFERVEIHEWPVGIDASPAMNIRRREPRPLEPRPARRRDRALPLDEIPSPGSKGFRYREGEAMFAGFVVRKGDLVVGYVDSCPHAGWPLAGFAGRS
jgi:hypothetical protein